MKTYRQLLEDVAALESRSERATPPLSKLTEDPFVSFGSTPPARSQSVPTTEEQRRAWGDELERLESREKTPGGGTVKTDKSTSGSFDSASGERSEDEKPPSVSFDSAPPGRSEPEAAITADTRRAWSDDLCRRLHAGVAHQSPPGLGRWDPAWEIVAAPSERLLEVLADWERTGNEADQRAAIHAAEDVAIAWERATHAWTVHKRELVA